MTKVPEVIAARLRTALDAGEGEAAIELLGQAKFPSAEPDSLLERRIQLAILRMVENGDGAFSADAAPDRFQRALELAILDWRDLLLAAGLADHNWFEVAVSMGLPDIR